MWQSLSRQAVGQPASRLPLPPPRAASNASPAQNVPPPPSTSQPASLGGLPSTQLPASTQPPIYNQLPHAPPPPSPPAPLVTNAVQPSGVVPHGPGHPAATAPSVPYGSVPQVNGAAAPMYGASAPQLNGGAAPWAAPSDFSQRVLMDYLAMVQTQLASMNQVVANTVAHNQALTAQNQALFEELRALKQHVEAFTAAGSIPGALPAGAAAVAPLSAPQPVVPPAPPAPSPAPGTAPATAAAEDPPASQPPGAAAGAVAVASVPDAAQWQPATAAEAVILPDTRLAGMGDSAAAGGAAAAQTQRPAPSTLGAAAAAAAAPAALPAPTTAAAAGGAVGVAAPLPPAAEVQLELLSMVASELASLTVAGAPPGADMAATTAPAAAPPPPLPPPAGAGPVGGTAAGTAGASPPPGRSPVRGGRYVGPPRSDVASRAFPRGEAAGAGTAAPRTGADGSGGGAGAPSGGAATGFGSAGGRGAGLSAAKEPWLGGRGAAREGRGAIPRAAKPADAGAAVAVKAVDGAAAVAAAAPGLVPGPAATAPPSAAGSPSSPSSHAVRNAGSVGPAATPVATAVEVRLRGCSSAAELRALVDEGRLSAQQAVLAAQQLPRLARLAAERQQQQQVGWSGPSQEARGPAATAAADVETELLAARELLLRLLPRFTSPTAISALRPAFLPNYLALAAVAAELRQPPSRAFAGAVRQLVTQHVSELTPELAAAGVAAVAQLDGTVAPGVLERACNVVTAGGGGAAAAAAAAAPSAQQLVGWKALVAAGQLAPLGRVAAEAARQVLTGAAAAATAAATAASPSAAMKPPPDPESLVAAAQGVLSCAAAGLAVPPALVPPLEAASGSAEALAAVGPSGQLLVAKALLAAGHPPQVAWLDVWEAAVVASLPRASSVNVAALAAALHGLTRGASRARPAFVMAVSERLLAATPGAGGFAGATACALALHVGELAAADGDSAVAVDATRLAAALLSVATASLASLDLPDLAALVSGLSLLRVRAPAEVWSALLSRATDSPAAAAAAAAAARRALEVGLPAGIRPASLEHFLSVGGQHVGELPAASLVGLAGLAAAVKGKLRPGLLAAVLTRVYDQATTLGPRDAALLFAAVDSLALPLTQPLAARPLAVSGAGGGKDEAGGDEAAGLTPAVVLRRTAEAALVPEQVLQVLGLERTAQLLELVARLQQSATAAAAAAAGVVTPAQGDSAAAAAEPADGREARRLMPRRQLLALLALLQPSLAEASPQALAAIAGSAAALELPVPPDWLAAVVAAVLVAAPRLDPMTWARLAAAVTRCEQLAGVPPGRGRGGNGDGDGGWLEGFVDDMQRKLAAAPPPALALTVEVLVAHGRRPPAAWVDALLAAAMPFLEAPLPLTQAQAAGAAAAAASVAAGRATARPAARSPVASGSGSGSSAPPPPSSSSGQAAPPMGPIATAFTPPQLAQLLGGLAALQQSVPAAWLAAAVRQVEGRAVHFTYRDLAETLYGIVRLGGGVRDALCNQLFIVSQAKLAAAPPALLARTLAVAAGGRKVSAKWWEEVQRVLVVKLPSGAAAADAAVPVDGAAGGWQVSDLCLAVESVLALRRRNDEAAIGPQLAAALAAVVSYSDGAVAAALSPDAAVAYVEACGEMPQLGGRPPLVLLEQYLSYSVRLLAGLAGDGAQRAAALVGGPQPAEAEAAGSGRSGAREQHRERKRARERAARNAARGGGGDAVVPTHLLLHLRSAAAVGKALAALPEAERLAAAGPWLAALAAAGAAAAAALPVSFAADMLWLIAKLEGGGGVAAAAAATEADGGAGRTAEVAALAARVGGAVAEPSGSGGGGAAAPRLALAPDAVVDTVWALQALGFTPGESLVQALARTLPRRLAYLQPSDARRLLEALADAGAAGVRAVAEADAAAAAAAPATARTASGPGARDATAVAAVAAAAAPKLLSTEVGLLLEAHMGRLADEELVGLLDAAATLELRLPPAVTASAAARLAAAATTRTLHPTLLSIAITSLSELRPAAARAEPPPPSSSAAAVSTAAEAAEPLPADVLAALCDEAAEAATLGLLGGVLAISQVAAALYDLGARPGADWVELMYGAILDDLGGVSTVGGGVRRQPLVARGIIKALYDMSARFAANYVTLALGGCRAAMEDLEGQLAAAEGALLQVPLPLPQAPNAARMVPVGKAQQQQQQDGEGGEGEEEEEELGVEDLALVDPELAAPLELEDVVMLLRGLRQSGHEPPEKLWGLLDRALAPALGATPPQQQQQAVAVLEVSDAGLLNLLEEMQLLGQWASEGLLVDLEARLGRRMPLLSADLLALFATHCTARSFWPGPKFMRLFRQRVEELVPQTRTKPAILLVHFLVAYTEAAASRALTSDPLSSSSDLAQELRRQKPLLQALLDCTRGRELLALAESPIVDPRQIVALLTTLVGTFGLRLPHSGSPERRSAWLVALQALSLGGMEGVGWAPLATLLREMHRVGQSPQPEWLAEYYRRLEATSATAPPHELADAASAAAVAGFQPALAPALPARLAAALESRLREFASTEPRFLVQLLGAVGDMGHVARTEVLQAAEVLLAKSLSRAPEVLREVQEAAAGAAGRSAEEGERLAAAAAAAEAMLQEETLLGACTRARRRWWRSCGSGAASGSSRFESSGRR